MGESTKIKELLDTDPEDLVGWKSLSTIPDGDFQSWRFVKTTDYNPCSNNPTEPYIEDLVKSVHVYSYPRPEQVTVFLVTCFFWEVSSVRYPKFNVNEAYQKAVNDCLNRLYSYEDYHRRRLASDTGDLDAEVRSATTADVREEL